MRHVIAYNLPSPTHSLRVRPLLFAAAAVALAACGSSASSTGFAIVAASTGAPISSFVAGDGVKLEVVEGFSDGSHESLASGTTVAWAAPTTITTLPSDSTDDSPFPAFDTSPTAVFITNAERPDRAGDLDSVVFVADGGSLSGSVTLTAMLTGATTGSATATIPVSGTAAGDATHGSQLYATGCSGCHGTTGGGSPMNPDGSFTLDGASYDFAAPGLNAADDNLASDTDWTPALLAVAARADLDNGGVVLRAPMPDWLNTTVGGKLLTTQDFKDIYAYLQTQQ